ncbi:hypothetical protein HYV10_00405 [Candidatus Dependentiae bacterium]|nr:hypothetical protein [Candidatus Dependentiae bacterium]
MNNFKNLMLFGWLIVTVTTPNSIMSDNKEIDTSQAESLAKQEEPAQEASQETLPATSLVQKPWVFLEPSFPWENTEIVLSRKD